ncbi:aurora borealis-like [Homarus americanus]|uniref:Protein aurora borealis n=1 Tax=Homarus americanus TaxID=6706 RepID=A0A8J5N4K7_HOMAM|nr:aurora borealis-like [Homarus americanus]
MNFRSSENSQVGDVESSEKEGGGGGQCTSTSQITRRPLQQLTFPTTSSPLSQSSLTPYKYHRCKIIPEEMEDQENMNPHLKQQRNKSSQLNSKPQGTSSDENNDSSPFAYPLIWESYHTSSSSPLSQSPSNLKNTPSLDGSHCQENTKSHSSDSGRVYSVGNSIHDGLSNKRIPSTKSTVHEDRTKDKNVDKEGSRTTKMRNKSGSNGESSSSRCQCHQSLTVTPSKSSSSSSLSDRSVFRTPSERFSSSKLSDSRGPQTPQRRRVDHHHSQNPFEVGAECLQLPAVSPSLFRQVVSPSQKADSKFRWSIDQLAVLHPANIETSPFNQADILTDPDYERQAQDAIDNSAKPMDWKQQGSESPAHVWCQTELTLPPVLPEAVEEALKPFCTFTQDQWWQGSTECDEGTNMNNTTLRRKLLFSHDELLNATPLCSPRGVDASGSGSPPSSPVAPLPMHKDDESPEGVDEEDDKGLMWCTAVVTPTSIGSVKEDLQLARHPPPSPPSPIKCVNPPSLPQQPNSSFILGFSPNDYVNAALPLLSPSISPIEGHLSTMVSKEPRLFSSPGVSPIHIQQHNNDSNSESGYSPTTPYLNLIPHNLCQPRVQISPGLSPIHLPTHSHNLVPINDARLQEDLQMSPRTSHHRSQHLSHQHCSPNKLQTQNTVIPECQNNKETSILQSPNGKCDTVENCAAKGHQKMENVLNSTQGFVTCEHNESQHQGTPGKTSSMTELRTSSNSGHFSSSPIRSVHRSPLEMDSPNRRFSDSPPLSPILYHSLMFQAQHDQQKSPPKFLQDQMKSNQLSLSQATCLNDDNAGRSCIDEVMMEDGQSDTTSSTRYPTPIILSSIPTTVMLLRSSSVCDMETDYQPSLEINGNDDSPSQDTGYQTGSLHTTNFSITAYSQESNFPSSTVLPHHKEQHSRFVNSPYVHNHNSITKAVKSENNVAWEKDTPE